MKLTAVGAIVRWMTTTEVDIVGVSASTHHLGEQLERVDWGDSGCDGCQLTKSVSAQSFVRLLENNKITLYPTPLLLG